MKMQKDTFCLKDIVEKDLSDTGIDRKKWQDMTEEVKTLKILFERHEIIKAKIINLPRCE